MEQSEMETLIRNIDARTKRIVQILPTFVTKDDAKTLLTKDDAKALLTKDDAQQFATKDDLKVFATKDDIREESERTRRHFDMVATEMKKDIALIAEGHEATDTHVAALSKKMETTFSKHDVRIMRLEAKSMKRQRKR